MRRERTSQGRLTARKEGSETESVPRGTGAAALARGSKQGHTGEQPGEAECRRSRRNRSQATATGSARTGDGSYSSPRAPTRQRRVRPYCGRSRRYLGPSSARAEAQQRGVPCGDGSSESFATVRRTLASAKPRRQTAERVAELCAQSPRGPYGDGACRMLRRGGLAYQRVALDAASCLAR